MTAVRVELHPAFVLHRRSYREHSLLLEVFSSAHGRVALIAKGGLRKEKRLSAQLQSFQPLLMAWSIRGDLGTLTDAEAEGAKPLPGIEAMLCGFYLNELLLRLLHRHDPHPQLYQDYRAALEELGATQAVEKTLRRFEGQLLRAIGYGVVMDRDVVSEGPVLAGQEYIYRPDRGPSRHWREHTAEDLHISGKTLLALAADDLSEAAVLTELKTLLGTLLKPHLGGRPLLSREWYRSRLKARQSSPGQCDKPGVVVEYAPFET